MSTLYLIVYISGIFGIQMTPLELHPESSELCLLFAWEKGPALFLMRVPRLFSMRVLSLFVLWLAAAIALPCTQNSDCGSQDATQPGLCVSGTCQCGFGYSPDRAIDPTSCSLTCSPPPVPDGTAFLLEPNVTVTAIAGLCLVVFCCDAVRGSSDPPAPWRASRRG
jgi:hypothetical protein